MNRSASHLFLLISAFLFEPTFAGEYFLIEREKYSLCRELVDNFNQFKNESPMVCDLQFHPDFINFKLPQWQELNAIDYVEIINRLLIDESNQSWSEDDVNTLIKAGNNKLYKAKIDINYDGHKNSVYRIKQSSCDPEINIGHRMQGAYRYFAEPNFPDEKHPKGLGGFNGGVFGALFLYKGRPYLHSWMQYNLFLTERSQSIEGPSPRIAIYETFSPRSNFYESFGFAPVCEIGYRR